MNVMASMEGNLLRLRVRSAKAVDAAVANAGAAGLRIFIENAAAVVSTSALLSRATQEAKSPTYGKVHLRLRSPDLPGEVDIAIGDQFQINPQIKGALKSIPGVLQVEDL